jgi:hypothetical protein
MAIREARWDCTYCGTKGNLGRNKSCHHCGRSRPGGTKFYLPDDAAEVTDDQLLDKAGRGADWICAFCGTSNKSESKACRSCGAAREATSEEQEVKTYALGEVPTTGDMDLDEKEPASRAAVAGQKSKIKPLAIVGAAILAAACIAIVAFLIIGGKDVTASVDGFEWQRAIDIEAFRTVTEEDWSVPTGGRILSEREEKHHDEQVLDHVEVREEVCGQIDLGDGFIEDKMCTIEEEVFRQEPVYQPYYTYEIDKWIVVRTAQDGGSDHSPMWPRADLTDGEREGERSETYTIIFKDSEGEVRAYTIENIDEWEKFESNQGVVLKLNALGGISDVER